LNSEKVEVVPSRMLGVRIPEETLRSNHEKGIIYPKLLSSSWGRRASKIGLLPDRIRDCRER